VAITAPEGIAGLGRARLAALGARRTGEAAG